MPVIYTPRSSAFGQHMLPNDGALLYVFEAGTTTPKATYSDPDETIAQTHPVVADGNGLFATMYVSGSYKLVLKDKNGVQLWSEDELIGLEGAFDLLGNFDSSTNAGNYPATGVLGSTYRVTETFVLNAASGSHQLYIGDFIVANKSGATGVDADWDVIKGGKIWLLDEDDFTSDSAILAPSQQSTKAFISTGTLTLSNKSLDSGNNSITIDSADANTDLTIDTWDANTNLTIDTVDANTSVTIDSADAGAILALDGDEANTSIVNVESIADQKGGTTLKVAKYPIGDWNMDSTASVSVSIALPAPEADKVVNASVMIIHDDADLSYPLWFGTAANAKGGEFWYNETTATAEISRYTGGFFDATFFNSTSFNRGWIYIIYFE